MNQQEKNTVIPTITVSSSDDGVHLENMFTLITSFIIKSKKVIVLTGAGTSCSSGIPDFRSKSNGIYNLDLKLNNNKHGIKGKDLFDYFTINSSLNNQILHNKFIAQFKQDCLRAKLNKTHLFIKEYFLKQNKLVRLYTQNIDGLEKRIFEKDNENKLVELHGNLDNLYCPVCLVEERFTNKLILKLKNEQIIKCNSCASNNQDRINLNKREIKVGELKPMITLYNEFILKPNTIHNKIDKMIKNDVNNKRSTVNLLIIFGTSLKVEGVKKLVRSLSEKIHQSPKGKVILVNKKGDANASQLNREMIKYVDYYFEFESDYFVHKIQQKMNHLLKKDASKPKEIKNKKIKLTLNSIYKQSKSQVIKECSNK